MAEKQKPKISNATVEKPSILKELIKYSVEEVIEPKSKEMMSNVLTGTVGMFSDALTKSIDRWIYPEGAPKKNNTSKSGGVYLPSTNYTVYSRSTSDNKPKESINQRSSVNINYIWVETEQQAKDIVTDLKEDIDNRGKATVASLYEKLVDENGKQLIQTNFTDFTHGWTKEHLPQIGFYREVSGQNRGKYFIDLPRPVNIENVR